MKKKTMSISIIVLSVLVILTCLLCALTLPTNTWFYTSKNNYVTVTLNVNNLNLVLRQGGSSGTVIDPLSENGTNVSISGPISVDTNTALNLYLENADSGTESMYVRFKVEIYALGVTKSTGASNNTLLTSASITAGSAFVLSSGYYYYQNSTGSNQRIAQNANVQMMSAFNIPSSYFTAGTLTGGETLRFVITIEGSNSSTFADA